MITIVNTSGGNLHFDTMALMLTPGQRFQMYMTRADAVVAHPDIETYELRGKLVVEEAPEQDSKEDSEYENS